MTGFESFVGVNPWTALFTFCNMLITFAVLRHFLFKPVKQMIDDRRQESRQQTYLETIFISSYQCKEIDGKQRRTACWDQMAELRQGDVSCHEQQDE